MSPSPEGESPLHGPICYTPDNAPSALTARAATYADHFGIVFDRYCYFPAELFQAWHAAGDDTLLANTQIASATDPRVELLVAVLTQIANAPNPSREDRVTYLHTLLELYRRLPFTTLQRIAEPDTLCVGIEREGRILAEALGWLPADRSIRPHAKRVNHEGGLIVGLTGFPPVIPTYQRCVLIDGAIASGATTMAVMEQLRAFCQEFHILSVHASFEGLRGLASYGRWANVNVHVSVAHATAGMNAKYYAVDPQVGQVIVGDLGDTISDLVER